MEGMLGLAPFPEDSSIAKSYRKLARALVLSLLAQSLLAESQTVAEEPVAEQAAAALQYAHGEIRIPAASADEPLRKGVSAALAQKYLKDAALAWHGKHKCISCHTDGTYMVVRPALSQTLGRPDAAIRTLFLAELESLAAEEPKKLQRGVAPAQVIYLAAGLAEWDAHVRGQLSPETDRALRLMFALQREHGSWGTQNCWPPYESDAYHLATVAAMAAATAPGWLEKLNEEEDQELLADVTQLKSYLRTEAPHDYGRTLLLWASARMPDLLDEAEKQQLIKTLLQHQRDDGGWSIRTMAAPEAWGRGNREEKLRAEADFADPASDGHMTGLAIIVLREAGLAADDPKIQRGLGWLTSHQQASGRWWTRSLNTDDSHFITYSGTAFPLLALQMCGSLPAALQKGSAIEEGEVSFVNNTEGDRQRDALPTAPGREDSLLAVSGAKPVEGETLKSVSIGGMEFDPASLPKPLVANRKLGLVTTGAISGQQVHVARDHLYETRATITPDGDYLLMFPDGEHYGGKPDKGKVNDLLAYRSNDKGKSWSGPKIAFDIDYNQHGFIPLIPGGTKRIYAFGTQPIEEAREGRENCPIGFRYSDDDGETFSEVTLIRPENDPDFKGMSVTRMCETDAGTWLIGSHEANWNTSPLTTRQYLLRSEDRGKTWTVVPGPRPGGWFVKGYGRMDEGRPINLRGGNVLSMFRTPTGRLWASWSEDDGKTWTDPKPTSLVHPDAPPMLFFHPDGNTLLAFHHNRESGGHFNTADRSEIWVSLSTDGGHSWSEPRFVLANALAPTSKDDFYNHQCSYLDAFADGETINLFLPHQWKRSLHLKLKASDLNNLPTKAQLKEAAEKKAAEKKETGSGEAARGALLEAETTTSGAKR